eukprot:179130-Chlamydomonas_euryale.AAC.2
MCDPLGFVPDASTRVGCPGWHVEVRARQSSPQSGVDFSYSAHSATAFTECSQDVCGTPGTRRTLGTKPMWNFARVRHKMG